MSAGARFVSCPHCGCALTKPRSSPHHKRFFAIIHAAYHHWPEDSPSGFVPDDEEHLRAWLLCKARHRKVRDIPIAHSDEFPALAKLTAIAIEAGLKEAGAYAFPRPTEDGSMIRIFSPKSIAFSECGQKEFSPIAQAVEDIIENEIGVPADQLLREKAA